MELYKETAFDLVYDLPEPDCAAAAGEGDLAPDEALVACVDRFGRADPQFLSALTGKSPQMLLFHDLRGAVFQDPSVFPDGEPWSPEKGWLLRDQYLCGNVMVKLAQAKKADGRFPGIFRANIEALQQILPAAPGTDEIHVSLGATWLPESFYEDFVKDLLKLSQRPSVRYVKSLSKWVLHVDPGAKDTVLSRYVYGTWDLPASRIIEQSMNAKTVKVYDYVHHYDGRVDSSLNQAKTLAAQEKQQLVLRRFDEWIRDSFSRRKAVEAYYSRAYVGHIGPRFDGSFLSFPGMNPDIRLHPHQRNAVARILLSGENVLLAHPVGTGKTFVMISAAHELKRMGLSGKNMVVVPNSILRSTVDLHRRLYPDDRFLTVYPRDFTPAKRDGTLREIRDGDYVCIYMAYSSFDMIVMSKDYWIAKRRREIRELEQAASGCSDKADKHALEAEAGRRRKQLSRFAVEAPECPWLTFDKLGVNTLFLDEAHNYKNIELDSRTDNIVGMHGKGSKKSREMLEKCRCADRLVFATGTPLTNSLADLFVMQTYLQPEELRYRNIDSFDMWINTFGERETSYEIDVDAKTLRPVTRFSSFHNLTELMSLFSGVCDFAEGEEDQSDLPLFKGYTDVCVPRSRPQAEYIRHLSKRTERIRAHKVKQTEDNLLKITAQGRACALDIRLVDTEEARICFTDHDAAYGKIHECAGSILRLYQRFPGTCQIVFSDIGTPKAGFNVYDELKKDLLRRGIPAGEIAFVHDAESESAKAALFREVNRGAVRVIVGSTQKLGTGVNVQEKLIALHHLSVPWRPADMIQREGRILRQGNTCEQVYIYRYITESSFDSYSWQLLENKQRFISSFLSGTAAARDREDIADAVLSYAEVKALAIGNPLIKKRVETANLLDRKKIAFRQRQKQMAELRAILEQSPEKRRKLEQLRTRILRDIALYRREKISVSLDDRRAFGEELKEALSNNLLLPGERLFDSYQGFDIVLPAAMTPDHPYVYVRSRSGSSYYLDMGGDKLLGFSMRIDHLLDHLPERVAAADQKLRDEQRQYQDAAADLDRGNPFADEIDRLIRELDRLDKELGNLKEETA